MATFTEKLLAEEDEVILNKNCFKVVDLLQQTGDIVLQAAADLAEEASGTIVDAEVNIDTAVRAILAGILAETLLNKSDILPH